MSASTAYEIVGYVGSALIVTAVLMKSILKLRHIGLAGAANFLVYGLMIRAYPIAMVNVVIIGIHLFRLRPLVGKTEDAFTVLHVDPGSRYLRYFLDFYAEEIRGFQPEFSYDPADGKLITVFLLRNLVPAGLFIGKLRPDHSIEVVLDFVIPQYRDFKLGQFLYSPRSGVFADPRCVRAWTEPRTEAHARYLERMGFRPTTGPDGQVIYSIDLAPLHEASDARE
jgi:hypothetical protein